MPGFNGSPQFGQVFVCTLDGGVDRCTCIDVEEESPSIISSCFWFDGGFEVFFGFP